MRKLLKTKHQKAQFKTWMKALRSGEFKQGQDQLEVAKGKYCCLGVACKVLIPESKQRKEFGVLAGVVPDLTCQPHAPKWLTNICMDYVKRVDDEPKYRDLWELNDNVNNFNFNEIADILELIYLHEALG